MQKKALLFTFAMLVCGCQLQVNASDDFSNTKKGLVQLWQVVPEGQSIPKGMNYDDLKNQLYCKVNHDLTSNNNSNNFDTYINSCYVDDAYFLEEEENRYKIYLSGYEGWVDKEKDHTVSLDFYVDEKGRIVDETKNGSWTTYDFVVKTTAQFVPLDNELEPYVTIKNAPGLYFLSDYVKTPKDIKSHEYSIFDKLKALFGIKKVESSVLSPSFYANEEGALVHYLSKDLTAEKSYSKTIVGLAPSWMKSDTEYYSYDGIYFYNALTDIDVFGVGSLNENNPYYNYYQFVPIRSKTNISGLDMNSFIENKGYVSKPDIYPANSDESMLSEEGSTFIRSQNDYGINGALQFAMGIHESGLGRSSISVKKNNLFGMNAIDVNPVGAADSFETVSDGIFYHADLYLSQGYSDPLEDGRYFGFYLGNKGGGMNVKYASDPFWGEKIAGHYYNLDKMSGFKDLDYYSLGVVSTGGEIIYSAPDNESEILYKTMNNYKDYRVHYYPVIVVGEVGDYYIVKTDTPLDSDGNPKFDGRYTWDNSNGYILKSSVSYLTHKDYMEELSELNEAVVEKGDLVDVDLSLNGDVAKENEVVLGEGVVVSETLNVREFASVSSKKVGKLNQGDKVQIFEIIEGWYKVKVVDTYAYVSSQYIVLDGENTISEEQLVENSTEELIVSGDKIGRSVIDGLNIRKEPNKNSGSVGSLKKGEEVQVIKEINGWYQIKYQDDTAYVGMDYLEIDALK